MLVSVSLSVSLSSVYRPAHYNADARCAQMCDQTLLSDWSVCVVEERVHRSDWPLCVVDDRADLLACPHVASAWTCLIDWLEVMSSSPHVDWWMNG